MTTTSDETRKPWRCRFGWHRWTRKYTDDGEKYVGCARCPKVTEPPDDYPTFAGG